MLLLNQFWPANNEDTPGSLSRNGQELATGKSSKWDQGNHPQNRVSFQETWKELLIFKPASFQEKGVIVFVWVRFQMYVVVALKILVGK